MCRPVTGRICPEQYPPLLSAAQSKERALARDYATASALPADPVPPNPSIEPLAKSAGLGRRAVACDGLRRAASSALSCKRQMPKHLIVCRRSGGTGSGGTPDKSGGNCEAL